MEKNILEQLINENFSQYEIAERTNKSQTTVRWWLKKYGLRTNINLKNKGGLAGKPKGAFCYCKKCGVSSPEKFYITKQRARCITCHTASNAKRYKRNKQKAVDYKGGKCCICGYNKCLASLDFHHVKDKDPKWETMRGWSFDNIKSELDKCILVCRNCHGEIHYYK